MSKHINHPDFAGTRDAKIHHSTADTRERNYDRLRKEGYSRESAQKVSEKATRELHQNLDRR